MSHCFTAPLPRARSATAHLRARQQNAGSCWNVYDWTLMRVRRVAGKRYTLSLLEDSGSSRRRLRLHRVAMAHTSLRGGI